MTASLGAMQIGALEYLVWLYFKNDCISFFRMLCQTCCCSTFCSLHIHCSLAYLSSFFLPSPATNTLVSAPQCTLNIL